MHLKSLSLKGFKSFPDRTKLEFGPGVSVVVGPNGSGKSNVTDAVLWAMGEQSPLAVRGQSMQDVIFGGGKGVQARTSAEVELVLDNADGTVDLPVGEVSIVRRLDRNGEGEYRLNGARCRLVDVLEVLSDTGLGKESHSVVSQGRVEGIVTSKPRDRRLLIEEAAGLGKHRKRRRRAQLKLERTQDNLDRALDVEREARSRLRPLKRQAEAAELHERLERQTVEARWELARDAVRARREDLATAEAGAVQARAARDEAHGELAEVARRREEAEEALARRTREREALARRVFSARSAAERVELRLERVRETAETIAERIERREQQLVTLRAQIAEDRPDDAGRERLEALQAEVEQLDEQRAEALERELAALSAQRDEAAARVTELEAVVAERREALSQADDACDVARRARRAAESSAETARREAARVGAELASANQFLRSHASAPDGSRSLADELEVEAGYELALAAGLGGRLSAAIVDDLQAARALLERSGTDGGRALVADSDAPGATRATTPPAPGARHLGDMVSGAEPAVALARRLLANTWVVDELDVLPPGFLGVAVTRAGRAWFGFTREMRQAARGGGERVLAERNRRDGLVRESERAVQGEQAALAAVEAAVGAVQAADATRDEADRGLREVDRARAEATEAQRRAAWLIDERRKAPDQGEAAVRRAQVLGELAAEQRVAERAARERAERAARLQRLEAALTRDRGLLPAARRLAEALATALEAVAARVMVLDAELAADSEAGEGVATALRACAAEEAQIQGRLRERAEAVTGAEVRAQQTRDAEHEATQELGALAERLGLEAEPATEPLAPEAAEGLRARIERLQRRREQLGPVNPLAKAEYDEALAHVEELERQRTDLETALRELRGLIRDTDRQIRETFEATFAAAARNFEQLAEELFPGGRGRLRLVREDSGPRPVLGGAEAAVADGDAEAASDPEEAEAEERGIDPDDDIGVEIEITPAGKSMKRLTLLSGGEKSMTAIAFLFAVFLARPCPFYILDEVEAALDDLNIGRFLNLLRAHAGRAQFIVVTHQKRTMEAADTLYGVSMGDDGVSKVVSRRLPPEVVAA
ncbi:MAG: chromosome segregation protein [Solirubrobacteraceae bacterium]|nr:chromosome segregation protein [Solirubrobacteraceae bacterium]